MPAAIASPPIAPRANIVFANFASSATMDSISFNIFLSQDVDFLVHQALSELEVNYWIEDTEEGG
jgi:hypothetical protein